MFVVSLSNPSLTQHTSNEIAGRPRFALIPSPGYASSKATRMAWNVIDSITNSSAGM